MDAVIEYRGRTVTRQEVGFIQELIAAHPSASRRVLSTKLCEAWDWRQTNGCLRDMVCRGLMLELHRGGHIELPAVRQVPPNPLARRVRRRPVTVDQTPVRCRLSELGELSFEQVRRSESEPMFDGLLEGHHYLGYVQPVGEHLKFLVSAGGRPLACLTWSSAPRHLGPRDQYIGWSGAARRANIRLLAYNSRFLILPWVEVKHLASHLLGQMAQRVPREWERLYGHPVYWLETFVDPGRFKGTCYRAANWVRLGLTTGRGKDDQTHQANRPLKEVMGYPLTGDFRERLSGVG
ncbi:MAG: hypothetical protein UY92_C0011G0059 [Candidatus Magasanikbacteria bacterium GW2011_GWA2_56_11]|uniref:Uncharacterized protein n=1 Tax=Candidatus Magasanikbacteria bacterium GW2011_GWA2_56_11 TaxID=1619044 RepID=A0A0G2AL76_9BACT|nr:MAG: hypothetical protein UY92_C0011G0059 [Candidatus Magasanikbacteria bacterium GW2011_GWA2_56_11]